MPLNYSSCVPKFAKSRDQQFKKPKLDKPKLLNNPNNSILLHTFDATLFIFPVPFLTVLFISHTFLHLRCPATMARGSSQSQSANSPTTRPGVMAPRGSAAATAGMRRRRLGGGGGGNSSAGVGGGSGSGANMLRFYTDDAPGLKISPTVVLVMSLCFIGFVTALHVFGKLYRRSAGGV